MPDFAKVLAAVRVLNKPFEKPKLKRKRGTVHVQEQKYSVVPKWRGPKNSRRRKNQYL